MPNNLIPKITDYVASQPLADKKVYLALPDFVIEVSSNSAKLLNILEDYFSCCLVEKAKADIDVFVFETKQFIGTGAEWEDWKREASKRGRKDAILDVTSHQNHERLVYKVRTGMLFWQNLHNPIALGPIETNPNQVINFILTQYLNHHLREDWLLGHAAGLQIQQKGLAIAGLSGGGKSTLMLHLLESGEHFISNDRLLIQNGLTLDSGKTTSKSTRPGTFWMRGVPKHPRINPGTIVYNPRLHPLISPEKRQQFLSLPKEELRKIEEKYDVDVNEFYAKDCYLAEHALDALVVLNWQADSDEPTYLITTSLNESPHLLPALMKSPGPFYANTQQVFLPNAIEPDPTIYLQHLGALKCFELKGKIDFSRAQSLVIEALKTL